MFKGLLTGMVAAALLCAPAFAQSISSLAGTMEVEHHRQQSRGELEGCSMVYRAAFLDHAHRKGQLAMVAGNFTFYVKDPTSAFLTIKAGVMDVASERAQTTAPAFAYLQSKHATTAKVKAVVADSDTPGFRMWVMPVNGDVARLLGDVMEGGAITLGLTRQGGNLDVLVPIDLTTASTSFSADGTVTRQRSMAAVQSFGACFSELASKLKR